MDLEETYLTKLSPSPWLYMVIWPVIYLFTFMWLGYGLSTLCRVSSPGTYLYFDPPFLPIAMYLCFAFTRILGSFWLYMAGEGYVWENLIVLAAMFIFATASLFSAVFGLDRHRDTLVAVGRKDDIALTIAFVHNGLGMYATWLLVASIQLLTVCLIYIWSIEEDTSYYITLSILLFMLLVFFFVDVFGIYQKTKFLFTPYVVIIVAFAAITDMNVAKDITTDPVNIFVMTVLGVAVICLFIKLIVIASREGDSGSSDSTMTLMRSKSAPPVFVDQPPIIQAAPSLPALMSPQPMMQAATLPTIAAAPVPQASVQYATLPAQPMVMAPPVQQTYSTVAAPTYTNAAAIAGVSGNPGVVYNMPSVIESSAAGAVSVQQTSQPSKQSLFESLYVASN